MWPCCLADRLSTCTMLIILMYTKYSHSLFVRHMRTPIWGEQGGQREGYTTAMDVFFTHVSYSQRKQRHYAISGLVSTHTQVCVRLTLAMLYSEKRIPIQEPGPLTNVPPCQRQRGFKTGGFGRLYHLQAIFQPIHLARIIECPCLSTPGGVTSYHKPPAPLLIKQGMGGSSLRRMIKKKKGGERRMDGGKGRGETGRVLFWQTPRERWVWSRSAVS